LVICKSLYYDARSEKHQISEFVCLNLKGRNTDETRKLIESRWNNLWQTDKVNLCVRYSRLVFV